MKSQFYETKFASDLKSQPEKVTFIVITSQITSFKSLQFPYDVIIYEFYEKLKEAYQQIQWLH